MQVHEDWIASWGCWAAVTIVWWKRESKEGKILQPVQDFIGLQAWSVRRCIVST